MISNDPSHGAHIVYAGYNLTRHCKNTPLSASSQLREELMNFSFHRPDSFLANAKPGVCLFKIVPEFLQVIKTLVCPTFFAHLI